MCVFKKVTLHAIETCQIYTKNVTTYSFKLCGGNKTWQLVLLPPQITISILDINNQIINK